MTYDPHRSNPNVHYRLYLDRNDTPTVICVQDFDYPDYDEARFLSPAAWGNEADAQAALVEYRAAIVLSAAYDALMPYTQHAQVRAEIAERVVMTLTEYHSFAAVEVLLANWPASFTRINRTCLSEVVMTTAAALKASREDQ